MEKVFEIYIRTTPERLWEAITDPRSGASTSSAPASTPTGRPARATSMSAPEAGVLLGEGENLEVDPPRRLVQTMIALWGDDVKSEGTSRVTWEIEPVGDSCRLTVTHDQLREGANDQLYGGWPMILSGPEDLARDRRAAHHARVADVQLTRRGPGPARRRVRACGERGALGRGSARPRPA